MKTNNNISTLILLSAIFSCWCISTPFAHTLPNPTATEKKIFIVTGEPSGDRLGAWYLEKLKQQGDPIACNAIGGQHLCDAGAHLCGHFNNLALGFVGLTDFLFTLPSRLRLNKQIVHQILKNNVTDVILVDCPLSNIPIARKLKKIDPTIHITYIAPPELWIWGCWGIDKLLKWYCDRIIVIYPFEVNWYAKHGLTVEWHGYPYYDQLCQQVSKSINKEKQIALLPGSRKSEVTTMLPIFAEVVKLFNKHHPEVQFVMPLAQGISWLTVKSTLEQHGIADRVKIFEDTDEKYKDLQACCLAIAKPGTNTLLLALLNIPTIIAYRVPWFIYLVARMLIQVPYVGLPNLLLDEPVCTELIQHECTPETIFEHAQKLYLSFRNNTLFYQEKLAKLSKINEKLQRHATITSSSNL